MKLTEGRPEEGKTNIAQLDQDVDLVSKPQVDDGCDVERKETIPQEANTLKEGSTQERVSVSGS